MCIRDRYRSGWRQPLW